MSITAKIVKVQSELKAPKGQRNSFGNYNYRSCEDILEAVKPLLAKESLFLSISDEVVEVGGRIYVKATALISDGERDVKTSAFAREPEMQKGMGEPQVTGSASSYARKYALNGLFCIDDTKDADTNEQKNQVNSSKAQEQYPSKPSLPWINEKIINSPEFTKFLLTQKDTGGDENKIISTVRVKYAVSKENVEIIKRLFNSM